MYTRAGPAIVFTPQNFNPTGVRAVFCTSLLRRCICQSVSKTIEGFWHEDLLKNRLFFVAMYVMVMAA